MGTGKERICYCFIFLILLIPAFSHAQISAPLDPIICYGNGKVSKSRIPYPVSNLKLQKLSTFEVTYEGLPTEAVDAFNFAAGIWENSIESPIPIRVKATWGSLEENALASTGATTIYRDFHDKALRSVWYPVPLAEKIAGKDLNGRNSPDINISINSNEEWYFGTDGNTPENRIDFVSVVLHELAHGLGIISSAEVKDNNGTFRESDYLLIYDYFIENRNKIRLSSHSSPSSALYSEFTSNNLFIHSPSAGAANNNRYPKIFAPRVFDSGSSISHLDEDEYPAGNPNSLMSPRFARAEAIHQPGGILLGILYDMGWNEQEFTMYPNPSSNGIYTLKFTNGIGDFKIKLMDAVGKEILEIEETVFNNSVELDLSHLPNGAYHAVIFSPMVRVRKTLILAKE